MDDFPEIWVSLLVPGDNSYSVLEEFYADICVAFDRWTEDNIDSLLKLELLCGDKLNIRASAIEGVVLSSPTGRARQQAWRKHLQQAEEYGG